MRFGKVTSRQDTALKVNRMRPLSATAISQNLEPPVDVELAFSEKRAFQIRPHPPNFSRLRKPGGNMLEYATGLLGYEARRRFITLKSAEVICIAHADGKVHGNVNPGVFYISEESVTLIDVGLYGLAQKGLDRIEMTDAHNYKAREELRMDPVVPTVLMDVHSWAKTVISLYTGLPLQLSFGRILPPVQPSEMPDNVWNIVVQCLDEGLNIQVDMNRVVAQLAAIQA
ncbi:hypothetical protein BDQ17DRAFT_495527 [Cyathus striatus]|nr:hypothetical protein BDQ17DRAFT_495527 [Cyathus striatus]